MKTILFIFTFLFTTSAFAQELLQNGDFTALNSGWTTTSDFTYNTSWSQYNFEIGYAYTSDAPNALGTLEQQATIPNNATSVQLKFFTLINSDETTSTQIYDFCTVNMFEVGGGGNSHQFIMLSNLNENYASGYQEYSFTVPQYFHGKNVRLVFIFGNDGATATRFRFDNVSLYANTSGGGGGGSPDFYVYNEGLDLSVVQAGDQVDAWCRQAYQGTLPNLVDVYLGYYLSDDPVLSSNDYFFPFTNEHSSIGNTDMYDPESETLTIPTWVTTGQYYIIFHADDPNDYAESNEQNNTVSVPLYINALGPPPPTVDIISPNTYMCIPSNSPFTIQTNITGQVSSKKAEYSLDQGLTWHFIDEVINTSTTFSPTWIPPVYDDVKYGQIKITVTSSAGTIVAISDEFFVLIPQTEVEELNPNGMSHLFNPFGSQHWALDGWVNGLHPGNGGSHYGEGFHHCADHYAKDFQRVSSPLNTTVETCNEQFYAPLSGTIIHKTDTCSPYCDSGTATGHGNQIVIQSSVNQNFAFRIAHLNEIEPTLSEGDFVAVGDDLGTIGATGTEDAHAHCALYKNILQTAPGLSITFKERLAEGKSMSDENSSYCSSYKNLFATKFKLDANASSGGGNTTSIDASQHDIIKVYPVPSTCDVFFEAPHELTIRDITIYDLQGRVIAIQKNQSNKEFYLIQGLEPGVYLARINTDGFVVTKRLIIQ